jgi:hypothetical protein
VRRTRANEWQLSRATQCSGPLLAAICIDAPGGRRNVVNCRAPRGMLDTLDQAAPAPAAGHPRLTPAPSAPRPRFVAVAGCMLLWLRVQDPVLRVLGFGACLDAALHLPPSPAVMPWPPRCLHHLDWPASRPYSFFVTRHETLGGNGQRSRGCHCCHCCHCCSRVQHDTPAGRRTLLYHLNGSAACIRTAPSCAACSRLRASPRPS